MSPENQPQGSKGSGFTTRQKLTAGIVIVVLIIIIWQVMGILGSGSSSAPPPKGEIKSKTTTTTSTTAPLPTAAGARTPGAPASGGIPMAAQPQPETPTLPQTKDSDLLKVQQETQEKYLRALNELQLLKIQREIAETNQAIASAELNKVTSEKGISDLLTKPVMPPSGPNVMNQVQTPPNQAIPPAPLGTPSAIGGYAVVSVSMVFGRWQAVINFQGKNFTVMRGDVLPMDGSVVSSINRDGVVLEKDGQKKRISLVPVI